MIKKPLYLIVLLVTFSCQSVEDNPSDLPEKFIVVLGIAQDAGYPQAGCTKSCCTPAWNGDAQREKVVSLGLVDRTNNRVWMFEATPDFKDQLHDLLDYLPKPDINSLGGIFLTHAHIGHYTGLMHLGHEVMGARNIPVYVMPRMKSYLETNGPWSQLVSKMNIQLKPLEADTTIQLSDNIGIVPFLVPHRDEYSETVGYKIIINGKKALFIPDIDKWDKWSRGIKDEVVQVDYAFLDATFNSEDELPTRNMNQIGHPFIPETEELFRNSSDKIKQKIIFIHFNHTNKLIADGLESESILSKGYNVAREGTIYNMDY